MPYADVDLHNGTSASVWTFHAICFSRELLHVNINYRLLIDRVGKSHLAHGSERCLRQVPTSLTIDNQLSSHEFMSNLTGRINRECMLKKRKKRIWWWRFNRISTKIRRRKHRNLRLQYFLKWPGGQYYQFITYCGTDTFHKLVTFLLFILITAWKKLIK